VRIQNLLTRHTGSSLSGPRIKHLTGAAVDHLRPHPERAVALKRNRAVLQWLEEPIEQRAAVVRAHLKLREGFQPLLPVSGIGPIWGRTSRLETGASGRCAPGGDFAAYCRWVSSQKLRNGKPKGQGKVKNGTKYLAGAVVEAATFAVRDTAQSNRFSQRKPATTKGVVALKAGAHT
jgi:transposase